MINRDMLTALAFETVQSPRTAARKIMGFDFGRDALWSGLVLVASLNSLIYSLSLLSVDTALLPPLFRNPVMFFVLVTSVLILTVHAFFWTGRMIGGTGDMGDLLSLMVWLQALRAIAQAVLFFLMLVSPALGQLFSLLVGVLGLWIIVNFITEGLRLPGLMHGVGVIVLAAVGIVFGLMILAGLIGFGAMGVPANV